MAEKAELDPLDELVSINLKVPARERRAFKVWCAERGITQVEAFRVVSREWWKFDGGVISG